MVYSAAKSSDVPGRDRQTTGLRYPSAASQAARLSPRVAPPLERKGEANHVRRGRRFRPALGLRDGASQEGRLGK